MLIVLFVRFDNAWLASRPTSLILSRDRMPLKLVRSASIDEDGRVQLLTGDHSTVSASKDEESIPLVSIEDKKLNKV